MSSRVTSSEEMTSESTPPPDDAAAGGERATSGARLMGELRQAQARADRAERELERTRRTAAYVVGDHLVRAAKDPRRLPALPRDLWRTWRLRRARRTAPAAAPARTRAVVDLDAARLLVPRMATVAAGRGLSIAGALGSATQRAWSPYAAVSSALPHEGAAVVEAVDPDIVVIDTSAALVGESWAHLGNPAAVDRLLAAGALVDAAHALGRPVVLLRMTPASHTAFLDDLARRCDLVLEGPGATVTRSPAHWHPGIDPLASVTDPEGPGLLLPADTDGLIDMVAGAAPRLVSRDPSLPPDLSWARALGGATGLLDSPLAPGLRGAGLPAVTALAAGRRVLAPGDRDLEALLGVRPLARSAAYTGIDVAELTAWAAEGPRPLDAQEHQAAFAAVLLGASAPVQLTLLAERLGILTRPRSCWDVALIADDDFDPDRILEQSWRPKEIVLRAPVSDRTRSSLGEAGIDVIPVAPGEGVDPALLGLASPYVAAQIDLRNPHDLVDLLAGRLLHQPATAHPTDARLVATT